MASVRRRISTFAEFYEGLSLVDVVTLEHSGRVVSETPQRADISMASGTTATHDRLWVRMTVDAAGYGAEYLLTLEARYEVSPPAVWPDEIEARFMQESAIVTLSPFMREALKSIGTRLGHPVPEIPLQGPPDARAV